ncbi:hypothetical protein [Novipirellula artificiosorum]|uniref:hypothetical protein n=1 Tax=Novipirellula artificiosorum TaxID=2528016 RepID=UPI0018CDD719|nr:hypothetical protein [Novipirellula artificiosorum]
MRLREAAEAIEKELAANSRPIGRLDGADKDKAAPEAKTQKNTKEKGNSYEIQVPNQPSPRDSPAPVRVCNACRSGGKAHECFDAHFR